jgi:hypothetical protein
MWSHSEVLIDWHQWPWIERDEAMPGQIAKDYSD